MKRKNEYKVEWLRRYKNSKYTLKEIEADMEEFALSFTLPKSQEISDMPKGAGSNGGLEEKMVILEQHQEKLSKQLDVCYQIRKEIKDAIEAISGVDSAKYRLLLTLKYINDLEWEDVAIRMSYSVDHCKGKLHGYALEAIEIPKENTQEHFCM